LISTTTNHLLPAAALGGGKDSKSALHLTQQRLMACFRFCHDQMQAFKYVSARRIPPLSAWHSEVFSAAIVMLSKDLSCHTTAQRK
jgi:hypothetical protein